MSRLLVMTTTLVVFAACGGRIGVSSGGVIYVETKDLKHNADRCPHEPVSGTTLLRGSDTALVTFDGELDCDSPGAATWSLNGTPQEELSLSQW